MDDELLAHHLDALYGAAREDFVDERDRRVRELRDADRRDTSRALATARKPTVPAWAVDQLARREADRVAELVAAGQELRDAQRRAASGRGGDALKAASRRIRDQVRDLRHVAADIISASGGSPASHLDDVERTLFTAAVTPEHHDALRRGILDRPLEGAGFGGVEGLLVAPDPSDDEMAASGEEQRRRTAERRRLRRQQRDLEGSRDDQQGRVERAETEAEQLRARAQQAEASLREERDELDRIATALAGVEAELGALEDADADPVA